MYEADIYLNGPENDVWELNAPILPRANKYLLTYFQIAVHLTEMMINFDEANAVTAVWEENSSPPLQIYSYIHIYMFIRFHLLITNIILTTHILHNNSISRQSHW